MTTYDFCKFLITKDRYAYEDMAAKLDLLMLNNRITDQQYAELAALMQPAEDDAAEPAAN